MSMANLVEMESVVAKRERVVQQEIKSRSKKLNRTAESLS